MNRLEKEKRRKYLEARAGKSPEEIAEIDRKEAFEEEVNGLAQEIHEERFPEEYDFMYDSNADAADRKRGKNPMRPEYIAEVAERRAKLGVSPLGSDGLPTQRDTWELAYAEAKAQLGEVADV